jgi:hypothetical protein
MEDVAILSRGMHEAIEKILWSIAKRVLEVEKLLGKLYKVNDVELTRVGIKY